MSGLGDVIIHGVTCRCRLTLKEQDNLACLEMLAVVWLSAITGIIYQYVFHERYVVSMLSTLCMYDVSLCMYAVSLW